jgi:polyferredoxin
LGWLRVINLLTFTLVFYWLRRWVLPLVKIEPFLTLGKASLRVFCAHLVFVFVGLALLYQDVGEDVDGQIEQLHGFRAIALLVVTFTALILIAASEVRRRRVESAERDREELTGAERAPVVR